MHITHNSLLQQLATDILPPPKKHIWLIYFKLNT